MEGTLDAFWQQLGTAEKSFPTGTCEDGTYFQTQRETIWFEATRRLARFRIVTMITFPDGSIKTEEYLTQCHPPSTVEMQTWLEKYGFAVEQIFGNRVGNPYTETSNRAIFWAKKD